MLYFLFTCDFLSCVPWFVLEWGRAPASVQMNTFMHVFSEGNWSPLSCHMGGFQLQQVNINFNGIKSVRIDGDAPLPV